MQREGRSARRTIILNGPPRSGKDTAYKFIEEDFAHLNPRMYKFSAPLKRAVHAFLDYENLPESLRRVALTGAVPPDPMWRMHDPLDRDKDKPHHTFYGVKPRDAYIAMSEQFAKPLWGKRIFGDILGKQMFTEHSACQLAVITDGGFVDELEALCEYIVPSRILIIQLHREGCSYDNDSRSYIELPDITVATVRNEHELELYRAQIKMAVEKWLKTS